MRLFEKLRALRLAKSDMGNAEKRPVGKNALELAENAIRGKDCVTLAVAAKQIAELVPTQSFLIEPLIVVADHLAQSQAYVAAVEAARAACKQALSGSARERQLVAIWAKHVDALAATDAAAAVEAARVAYGLR